MNDQVSKKLDDLLAVVGCDAHPRTIAGVVMWLYNTHGIWVYAYPEYCTNSLGWDWCLDVVGDRAKTVDVQERYYKEFGEKTFKSIGAAYEHAIEYTLENLI